MHIMIIKVIKKLVDNNDNNSLVVKKIIPIQNKEHKIQRGSV